MRHAHRRAHVRRLHEHVTAEVREDRGQRVPGAFVRMEGHVSRLRDAGAREQLLGDALVHRHRARENAAADIGHIHQFEHSLHRPVLTQGTVQHGQHDDAGVVAADHGGRFHRRSFDRESTGDGPRCRSVEREPGRPVPRTVPCDADTDDVVLLRIGGTDHVRSGDTTDVMFC